MTDGTGPIRSIAEQINTALRGCQTLIVSAAEFAGNDILPAEAFFLGCEKPRPPSFAYLAELLGHINLAGRPCGVFSVDSERAIKYLSALVHDCEAALGEPFLAGDGSKGAAAVKAWAKGILK
ncbi:hypothetical protein AGMMS50268_14930 [Spirochaetia bacterium]|nr:hypothetical protein AGMMS50268_14930 [Spirochaetia bacterium]